MAIRGLWAHLFAPTLLVLVIAACGGAKGPPPTSGPPGSTATNPPPVSTNAAVPGGWQGTITFHLVRNIDTTESSTNGEGIFRETTTEHFELQSDVTDTFTVTGSDPEDLEFGIGSVDLAGQAANAGTTLERVVYVSDKHNALGCHYLDETGSEIDGSWTLGGEAQGEIDFNDDGTYRISIGGGDPGEEELPKLMWITKTILEGAAIDCPPPGRSEVTGFGQYGEWAYSTGGGPIAGTLDTSSPGSVLNGSVTSDIESPKATVTVTWHLVHDGPITLPHD
jgi:hypothetical protein